MKVHKRLQLLGRKICVFFLAFVDFKARLAIKRTPSRFYVRYTVLSSLVNIKEKTEKTERIKFSVEQFTRFLVSIIIPSYSLLFFQCMFYCILQRNNSTTSRELISSCNCISALNDNE